ncbi:hydroxyethylthiazole kinase [Furfurilactobacillus sp. WILCCON 0119]
MTNKFTAVDPALLMTIRAHQPVVLNLSNIVTVNEVANALSAIGASPIMSCAPEETADLLTIADAVVLNLGTWTPAQVTHMEALGQAANTAHVPVIVDPVAVDLPKRRQVFDHLMAMVQPTVIRGNTGEIASLAGLTAVTRGIDAANQNGLSTTIETAKAVAAQYHCCVVATGPIDIITDGDHVVINRAGTPLFATHVGSGDLLSSALGAFLAVSDQPLTAIATGTALFGAIGAWTVTHHQLTERQPGTFGIRLLDALCGVTANDLAPFIQLGED